MKISASSARRGVLLAVLAAGVALPVLAQDKPESLLPPGFDQPAPTPAPAPAPAPAPPASAPGASATAIPPAASADSGNATLPTGNEALAESALGNETAPAVDLSKYELPDFARHSLDRVGVVAIGNTPLPLDAFGRSNGHYLETLMRRLDAPVASRWLSILLRRGLMSRVHTPAGLNGADFAAERVWLLLRMGEAVSARAVAQDVDPENYTPKLYQMAMQAALANGDPGGLCPLADGAVQVLNDRGWAFAKAMCAGLSGKPNEAGKLLDAAKRGYINNDIDGLLAENIMGKGAQGKRAVTIQWDGVDQLTSWRWGLAVASGVEVPEELYKTTGIQLTYWRATAPGLPAASRVDSAELAAAQGVFSNAGLVDLYSEIEAENDTGSPQVAIARDLRTCYTAQSPADRIVAMRSLWNEPETPRGRFARLVLTARAASWIEPSADHLQDADRLIASMLTAGLDERAIAWERVVSKSSDAWAMLMLADPRRSANLGYGQVDAYRNAAETRKAQLFVAGLAGLGRLSAEDSRQLAAATGVEVGASNAWTRAIDDAARRHEPGTVVLLAAVGMQTRDWAKVPPETLFHIVAALRVAGLPGYARMIAAEAIARA